MRRLLAFVLSLFVASATPTVLGAAPARDWSTVARATPAGYVIGNPTAKVKLVEYVSYTCPHCRHFVEQSHAVLMERMVRSGSTSVEVRNQLHDKIDLVAAVLAHCIGARNFPKYHAAVYAAQDEWYKRAADYDASGAVAQLPDNKARARAFADKSGLSEIARKAGMTAPQLDACFNDEGNLAAVAKMAAGVRADVDSTPAFEINGRLVLHVGWADLEPQLRAAGAK
jgi:protein-disulfide isomerase